MIPGRPRKDRFRILSVDGGGIRGLIPALVLAELESRVREATVDEELALSDCFHLLSGTSTGGLIALGLTVPNRSGRRGPKFTAEDLVRLYRDEGPRIFERSPWRRIFTLDGWIGPKYSSAALEEVAKERFGDVKLRRALREVVITSYDMKNREPHFFKRWRAAESADRNPTMVAAALATAAAPTYFPSVGIGGSGARRRRRVRRQPDGGRRRGGAEARGQGAGRPRPARADGRLAWDGIAAESGTSSAR